MNELWQSEALLRAVAEGLRMPTYLGLFAAAACALFEVGVYVIERCTPGPSGAVLEVTRLARGRIDRADLLARVGPMLGLMGTLIPLGPGLAALGRGELSLLAAAVTVAFDTTVLGLAVGMVGFMLGRARRRLYDRWLDQLEQVDQEVGQSA